MLESILRESLIFSKEFKEEYFMELIRFKEDKKNDTTYDANLGE